MSEVYSKEVVDKYLAGIFEILGALTIGSFEARIQDGEVTRDSTAQLFKDLAVATGNPAAMGFYNAMAEKFAAGEDRAEAPAPFFTVIDGGKDD